MNSRLSMQVSLRFLLTKAKCYIEFDTLELDKFVHNKRNLKELHASFIIDALPKFPEIICRIIHELAFENKLFYSQKDYLSEIPEILFIQEKAVLAMRRRSFSNPILNIGLICNYPDKLIWARRSFKKYDALSFVAKETQKHMVTIFIDKINQKMYVYQDCLMLNYYTPLVLTQIRLQCMEQPNNDVFHCQTRNMHDFISNGKTEIEEYF